MNVSDNLGYERIAGSRKSFLDLIESTKSPKRKNCRSDDESEEEEMDSKKKKADQKAKSDKGAESKNKGTES